MDRLELQYRLLSDAETVKFPRLPILIDFVDLKQNVANMLRLVKSRSLTPPEGVDVESLLKLGHACILIDDVSFGDFKRMSILRDFVLRYPKVRYVFSSAKNSTVRFGAHVDPELQLKFDTLELCVLRRRDMRELVMKLGRHSDVDIVLDRLQSEFQEINLPFTAANGSILMAIYEEQSNFRPINRSVLIEQFIDTTLRKAAVEQSRRETFDYANKTALLAHVAAWMATQDDYVPSQEAVRETMKKYLDRVGLYVSLNDLMAEFLSARIFLNRTDERLSFRYRAVLEYFIAMQMRESPSFKDWVMDEGRYLQFINEIQYYAGKLRNDADLVKEVGDRFTHLMGGLASEFGETDFSKIAALKLPARDSEISADYLSNQLSSPPMSPEERDEELQADLPRDVEERQEVFRPRIEDDGQRLLVALFLYSGVLKNMELIDDSEKRRHLEQIWKGWATFLHLSLSLVTDLASKRRIRLNGVLYAIKAPHAMADAELTRIISLMMPTAVSRFVAGMLGTEKLERQLLEPELSATPQPLVYELFRVALIADLRLSGTPGALRTALDHLRPSPYLREALIWKIADLRRFDRLKTVDFEAIAATIAGALAELKGGRGKHLQDEKRRQLQLLHQEGLRLRLKRGTERD